MKIRMKTKFYDFEAGEIVEALINPKGTQAIAYDRLGDYNTITRDLFEIIEEKPQPEKPEVDEPRLIGPSLISSIGHKPSKITIEF